MLIGETTVSRSPAPSLGAPMRIPACAGATARSRGRLPLYGDR
jgi:hypothetical protein